jgi:hypothetical protein
MKLSPDPRLPAADDVKSLKRRLYDVFREIAVQVNAISDGAISGANNAATAAPTIGSHARGDFVRNQEPEELGTAGSKYVIYGWQCVVSGSPGTWKEMRFFTGE